MQRFGNTPYTTIVRDFDALRRAIRLHDSFATEAAWEKCERWLEAIPNAQVPLITQERGTNMTDTKTDAPTLQERLRKASGSKTLRTVLLGMHNAEQTCMKAADALDESEAVIAELVEALRDIARPKVGPDHDWSDEECNKWRASWYRRYENIARAAIAKADARKRG